MLLAQLSDEIVSMKPQYFNFSKLQACMRHFNVLINFKNVRIIDSLDLKLCFNYTGPTLYESFTTHKSCEHIKILRLLSLSCIINMEAHHRLFFSYCFFGLTRFLKHIFLRIWFLRFILNIAPALPQGCRIQQHMTLQLLSSCLIVTENKKQSSSGMFLVLCGKKTQRLYLFQLFHYIVTVVWDWLGDESSGPGHSLSWPFYQTKIFTPTYDMTYRRHQLAGPLICGLQQLPLTLCFLYIMYSLLTPASLVLRSKRKKKVSLNV